MSCLVESIAEAMKNLPILSTYTGTDGMKYLEDSNLKDVCHLAETICNVRRNCMLVLGIKKHVLLLLYTLNLVPRCGSNSMRRFRR